MRHRCTRYRPVDHPVDQPDVAARGLHLVASLGDLCLQRSDRAGRVGPQRLQHGGVGRLHLGEARNRAGVERVGLGPAVLDALDQLVLIGRAARHTQTVSVRDRACLGRLHA